MKPNTATEEESKALIDRGLEIKEQMISLDKQYSERLLSCDQQPAAVEVERGRK